MYHQIFQTKNYFTIQVLKLTTSESLGGIQVDISRHILVTFPCELHRVVYMFNQVRFSHEKTKRVVLIV
jgi:hypothetical protein